MWSLRGTDGGVLGDELLEIALRCQSDDCAWLLLLLSASHHLGALLELPLLHWLLSPAAVCRANQRRGD